MADEKAADASGNGSASESSGAAGSFDQWFGAAGIDTKSLPDAGEIKTARDFYSKYGGESELYTKSQLEEERKAAISKWLPENYTKLQDYFSNLLKPQQQQAAAGQIEDPVAQQIEALKKEFGSRLQSHESVLAELVQLRQDLSKQGELNQWQKQFSERVKGTIKQAGGRFSPEAMEREVMRRYAAGEIRDDSPAGVLKAVKGLLQEKDRERQEMAREFAEAGLLRQEGTRLKPDLKLSDVYKDRSQMDALLEQVINHGLPDGQ